MESLHGSDALLTIAEVLVALAAASGIILALTRDPDHWEAFDAVRVFQLLASSLGGTFLALLPFRLRLAGLGDAEIWRIASGAMVAFVLAVTGFGLRMFRTGYGASSQSSRLWLVTLLSALGLLKLVAQILNGLAIVFDGYLSIFLRRVALVRGLFRSVVHAHCVQPAEACRLRAPEHPCDLSWRCGMRSKAGR